MNTRHLLLQALCLCGLVACRQAAPESDIIDVQPLAIDNGKFTPEVMWAMGQLAGYAVSPDGQQVVYGLRYVSMEANKGNTDLYLLPTDGLTSPIRLTRTAASESNLMWLDNQTILFARGNQIIAMDIASQKERLMGQIDCGFEGFKLSPDHSSIVYIATLPVPRPEQFAKLYAGLDQTTARLNEDLMYRHWDCWVDDLPHLFYAPIINGKVATDKSVDILEGEPYECPMRPWGGIEQFNYSPDGKQIAYTCRKKTGYDYAHSTNSDIYLYDIASGDIRNLCPTFEGYDQNPVFSHDGKMIAWVSMARDGYESDKSRLMVLDIESGLTTDLTADFDYNVGGLTWTDSDQEILANVPYRGMNEIFAFNLQTKARRQITHSYYDVNGIALRGTKIIAPQVSIQSPAELYVYSLNDSLSAGRKLTTINDPALSQLRMGRVEEHWIPTTDGKQMLTWLVYPYDYDSTRTYPAILYCLGGPQGMVSQSWSTRWNLELMSGAGYFVIAPNRRGCVGFGSEWCEEISGDYGGLCMQDLMAATDHFANLVPQIDRARIGATGASFGGYSVYWLAGHNHDVKGYPDGQRFHALLAHDGMFNFEQQYLETEEAWFTNWDLGGPYWEHNPQTLHSYANSPHRFVDRWNTPICVVHSEQDFRIVASQGMAAYNAAQLRHIPSRYLYFPDENHWVLRPQNSLLWHRNFIDWFDRWLK